MGPEFIEIINIERAIYTYINVNYIQYFEYSREDDTTEIHMTNDSDEEYFCFDGNLTEEILKHVKHLKKGVVT